MPEDFHLPHIINGIIKHKVHHQTVGNLDKRGMGDVMTLTVDEYNNSSKNKKLFLSFVSQSSYFAAYCPHIPVSRNGQSTRQKTYRNL